MLQKIIEVVKECGCIIKNACAQHVELKNQDRRNLVTEYDLQIQSVLKQKLTEILPSASFFGEEGENNFHKEGYCFVCDPIDGTTNFVKSFNFSCVSVALLKDGKPVLGVIYNPYLDELFCAEKGKGATLNGMPIHTTKDCLADSLVTFGTGVEDLSQIDNVFEYAKKCFKASIDVRRCGSAALDLCNLACGRIGYFFEFKLCSWDYSAAVLIVEEAGGIVKTEDFKDIDDYFQTRKIFAMANNDILQDVLKI
ncbi:MAG: inositol monophosphatase [Alphaproteobacteria bacterium]|nr:inositol monophosphatase [Alphaproteobacteria bacterium]